MTRQEIESSGGSAGNHVHATKEMAAFCFDILSARLEGRAAPRSPSTIPTHDKFPLFVTWTQGREEHLRGCIGTFSEMHLPSGLAEYAITSSLRDSRFDPVRMEELPSLACGVSLLIQFEPARDWRDWHVGVHGIRIHFADPSSGRQRDAVFLPEIAPEQGWDHVATLDHLIKKAGYRGEITDALLNTVRVTRFQSSKSKITYNEWARDFRK